MPGRFASRLLALAFGLALATTAAAQPGAPLPLPATQVGNCETKQLLASDPDSGMTMRAIAVLPPGAPPGPWKVLVLLHGLGGSARSWLEATTVVPQLASEMRAGSLAPTLILLPDGGNGYWADWIDGRHPYGSLVLRLMDVARQRYPLAEGPQHAAIVGASMGGFGALSLALREPARFGMVVALSATDLAIAVADAPMRACYVNVVGAPASASKLAEINPIARVRAGAGAGVRFLLAWGDREARKFKEGGALLFRALRRAKRRVERRVVRGGRHGWQRAWAPLHPWWTSALRAHFGAKTARP
ncbi:MAG: alpha/beta fold hydrolase [Deltaproteobacteria bacterium]|nr:alpha/beta fold hydrolase [Deltaproteobacteria bacterium]